MRAMLSENLEEEEPLLLSVCKNDDFCPLHLIQWNFKEQQAASVGTWGPTPYLLALAISKVYVIGSQMAKM